MFEGKPSEARNSCSVAFAVAYFFFVGSCSSGVRSMPRGSMTRLMTGETFVGQRLGIVGKQVEFAVAQAARVVVLDDVKRKLNVVLLY